MPLRYEDDQERRREPPEWEPEPLQLPLELPRRPEHLDEVPAEPESGVVVIDLV